MGTYGLAGFFAAGLLLGGMIPALAGNVDPVYFTAVGTNRHGSASMRTQFEFINEGAEPVVGSVTFYCADGAPVPLAGNFSWGGDAEVIPGDPFVARFSVKPGSVASLLLNPEKGSTLGWAKVESSGPLRARASLEIARFRIPIVSRLLSYEDQIDRVVELQPGQGIKQASFPVWLWLGHRQLSTSFALANLAGVPGEVKLTLGSGGYEGDTKTVTLAPGQFLADYFENFWEFAVPAIFPFQLRSFVKIESRLPLGLTALTTDVLSPLSAVSFAGGRPVADEVPAVTGEEFSLSVDDRATLAEAGISVVFWNVLGDSRCPVDAVCVWQGEAVLDLILARPGQPPVHLRLAHPAGPSAPDSVAVGDGLSLRLVRVEPLRNAEDKPLISEYRAVLVFERDSKD